MNNIFRIGLLFFVLISLLVALIKWGESRNETKRLLQDQKQINQDKGDVIKALKAQKELSNRVRQSDSGESRSKWMHVYFGKTNSNQ